MRVLAFSLLLVVATLASASTHNQRSHHRHVKTSTFRSTLDQQKRRLSLARTRPFAKNHDSVETVQQRATITTLTALAACRGGAIFGSKKKKGAPAIVVTKKKKVEKASHFALVKIGIASVAETFIMHQVLLLAISGNSYEGRIGRFFQIALVLSVPFGSSTYGSLIDNGLTAATKQIMSPNEIPGDADWYANLKKPIWNPPGWVFPIMWLLICKPTQFVALWNLVKLMGTDTVTSELNFALAVYCTHLAFGDAWNKVFFGLQKIGVGVVVITTFWTLLLASTYLFYQLDPSIGRLLVPTCIWVTIASSLNWGIYFLNPKKN